MAIPPLLRRTYSTPPARISSENPDPFAESSVLSSAHIEALETHLDHCTLSPLTVEIFDLIRYREPNYQYLEKTRLKKDIPTLNCMDERIEAFKEACQNELEPIHWYFFHERKHLLLSIRMQNLNRPREKYTLLLSHEEDQELEDLWFDGPRNVNHSILKFHLEKLFDKQVIYLPIQFNHRVDELMDRPYYAEEPFLLDTP